MLLAMRQYNENLKESHAGSLIKIPQQSNWKHQAMIISELCRVLQSISRGDAQALPLKDLEAGGFHDKLCSMCHADTAFLSRQEASKVFLLRMH
ncbi:TPA: hypothetical protein ACH3X3_010294 [Trebouxia sp. C0006]